ncbi:MAG TPA: acyltransferase [Solirubrobacteraceae bacterium]|jgi:serine acetyltransferase|nr:acyltransferase [Solirubrobacteraceae bacterium]
MLRATLRKLHEHTSFKRDPIGYHRRQGVHIGERLDLIGGHPKTFGSEPYLITIGDDVTISNEVVFITHDGGLRVIRHEHPGAFYYAPITVGDRVFIGAGAWLLPGVHIGAGAIIGARALVTREVPPNTVVAGVPARPIKSVEEYVSGHVEDWLDTAGLASVEKRGILEKHLMGDPPIMPAS